MPLHPVQVQLRLFTSARQKIDADRDLSREGADKKKQFLQGEIAAFRPEAQRQLARDWQALRGTWTELQANYQKAQEKAAQAWDYQRLNYAATAARSMIASTQTDVLAGVDPLAVIAQHYQAARDGGDRHQARAWADVGPAALRERFGADARADQLAKRMAGDLDALTDTPDLARLRERSSVLVEKAVELHQATREAQDTYASRGNTIFGLPDEFDQLLEGVSLQQKVDPSTLTTLTTLNIVAPEPMPARDLATPA